MAPAPALQRKDMVTDGSVVEGGCEKDDELVRSRQPRKATNASHPILTRHRSHALFVTHLGEVCFVMSSGHLSSYHPDMLFNHAFRSYLDSTRVKLLTVPHCLRQGTMSTHALKQQLLPHCSRAAWNDFPLLKLQNCEAIVVT